MNRNLALDIIRIVATISVVVGHLFQFSVPWCLVPFTKYGGFGVALFFLLSGYLVTSSVLQNPRWSIFLTSRSFRILPAYVLAFVIYAGHNLVQGHPYTLQQTFMYLTFTGYIGGLEPTLMGVEWTLRIEVLFYVLAVLGLYVQQVAGVAIRVSRNNGVIFLLITQVVLSIATPFVSGDQRPFTIGQSIIVGILIKLTERFTFVRKFSVVCLSTLCAEVSMHLAREQYDSIPFISMAVISMFVGKRINVVLTSKLSGIVQLVANCTYSVYLYHNWVLRKLIAVTYDSLAVLLFMMAMCILYLIFERPFNSVGRKFARLQS